MKYSNTTTENDNKINDWIQSISLDLHLGDNWSIQPMVGDCSVRKYYLLKNNQINPLATAAQQFVIMQTPIDNSMKNFINIAKFLANLNLPITIPTIYAIKSTPPVGYLLLSYLGEKLLFKNLNHNTARTIYKTAWQAMASIQLNAKNISLPVMDRRYIKKTLLLFKTWYLTTHLHLTNLFNINSLLDNLEDYFVKIFASQPQVFVHVDYHSKNLLLPITTDKNMIGILDFQDAMLGPITYDIVSLLQDAYLVWPEDLTETILFDYYDYLVEHNPQFNVTKNQFVRYFYLTGLQRHLKNLGIFARMKYFYKKPDYLQYIPNLLHYIHKTCDKFPDPELGMIKKLLINTTTCHTTEA